MFSPINIELTRIAKGIDNCAPITNGDIMFEEFNDKYKNKFTDVPIAKENPTNGKKYFLFGSLNWRYRCINTKFSCRVGATKEKHY